MDVIQQHIRKSADLLNNRSHPTFEMVFDGLKSPKKNELRSFLKYLDEIILYPGHVRSEGVEFIHFHLPVVKNEVMSAILEWIVVQQFYTHFRGPKSIATGDQCFIEKKNIELDRSINDPSIPSAASAKNGGNKVYREHLAKKRKLRELKAFYQKLSNEKIGPCIEFTPYTLLNVLHKEQEIQVSNFFEQSHYCILPEELNDPRKRSYVLLNDSLRISEVESLKFNGKTAFDDIENVILFDCISQVKFSGYNYRKILEFNKEGNKIKRLIAFSFEKANFSLSHILSRLITINSKLYIRPNGVSFPSYLIHPYELAPAVHKPEWIFLGDSSIFCHELCELIQDTPELKELYSIKLRNIYSLSWNSNITRYILTDIFEPNVESALISRTTKDTLLRQTFVSSIKDRLSSILHIIEGFGHRYIEQCSKSTNAVIIIPYAVLTNARLLALISSTISKKVRFDSWKAIKENKLQNEDILILDYRDCGNFPFNITPNLYEIEYSLTKKISGVFLTMFFKGTSDYTQYRYRTTLFDQIMGHPFRYDNLEWKTLKNNIEKTRPQNDEIQDLWDLENSYEREYDHTSIEFTFEKGLTRKFYPSQLLIFSEDQDIKHVDTAEHVYENYKDKALPHIQSLEKSYEGIHLFEFTDAEREELTEIQGKYELTSEEKKSELWKVFLLKRTAEKTWVEVFNEIEKIAGDNDIKFISKHHFQHNWLDYKSETLIPRSKKLFKLICDYLGLEQTYFRLMLKQRAKERMNARTNNSQMNSFSRALFDFGLFDTNSKLDPANEDHVKFINKLIKNHDLEEIWTDPTYIYKEISVFLELSREAVKLEAVTAIKKVNA